MSGGLAAMSPARRVFLGVAALGVAVTLVGVVVPVAEVRWGDQWPTVFEIDSDTAGAEGVRDTWPVTSAEVRWNRTDPVIRVAHGSHFSGVSAQGEWLAWIAFAMLPALVVMAAFSGRRAAAFPLLVLAVSAFALYLLPSQVSAQGVVLSGAPVIVWWPTAALLPVGAFVAGAGSVLRLMEPPEMEDAWVARKIAVGDG